MLDPRLGKVVAVARTGSFTAAAEMVGVTQSAITRSTADLEREIGYAIFHRTARGALLTEQGRDFVERAERLLEDARALLRPPAELDAYAGVLRIGVCPASLQWCLIEPLDLLLSRHHRIRLDVTGGTVERVVLQLRNGGLDAAFGFDGAFNAWSDLRCDPVGTMDVALFVRRGHPLAGRPTLSASDLAEFDFVCPSDSRPYGELIRGIYEDKGVERLRRLHIVDYFPIIRHVVEKSDAVGVAAVPYTRTPQFQERFVDLGIPLFPKSGMSVATRAAWSPTLAQRALIAACAERMYI
jgi:DNA-binding transcriptional LysR family regulator